MKIYDPTSPDGQQCAAENAMETASAAVKKVHAALKSDMRQVYGRALPPASVLHALNLAGFGDVADELYND